MEILDQISAKGKAFQVIESCVNTIQCDSSENYINLYHDKFEDMIGYHQLKRFLEEHKLGLLNNVKNKI